MICPIEHPVTLRQIDMLHNEVSCKSTSDIVMELIIMRMNDKLIHRFVLGPCRFRESGPQ